MKRLPLIVVLTLTTAPVFAQQTRQLDAHEHGVGQLNIALDGAQVAMEFHAPGADIVGFEYAATSAADRATIDDAIDTLEAPLDLFVLTDAAGCTLDDAHVQHEAHGATEADAHDDEHDDHDDHAEDADHDDHDDHAEDADHDDHAHDDHDDHADEAGHSEFHAEYAFTCASPSDLTDITFAYFDAFPNAMEVDVQVLSDTGAASFEATRDDMTVDLTGAL
ncbi:DUF2796 domain-containing protein [Octadecabacter sp.]|nr:DUF2796 domain-containing protein [Octadecabacter sp.]